MTSRVRQPVPSLATLRILTDNKKRDIERDLVRFERSKGVNRALTTKIDCGGRP